MIIAVDFDGVLCENQFPEIGRPNYEIVSLVREIMDAGHEVILWTSRNGQELKNAVKWCHDRGLHFCAVNEPAPSNAEAYEGMYEAPTRKVYADVYIDDHNLEFVYADGRSIGYQTMIKCIRRIISSGAR